MGCSVLFQGQGKKRAEDQFCNGWLGELRAIFGRAVVSWGDLEYIGHSTSEKGKKNKAAFPPKLIKQTPHTPKLAFIIVVKARKSHFVFGPVRKSERISESYEML